MLAGTCPNAVFLQPKRAKGLHGRVAKVQMCGKCQHASIQAVVYTKHETRFHRFFLFPAYHLISIDSILPDKVTCLTYPRSEVLIGSSVPDEATRLLCQQQRLCIT